MVMLPAEAPTKVFSVPKLCRNGVPPKVSTPTDGDVVLGSASEFNAAILAAKFPEPSRRTMALAVFVETALETTVVPDGPVTSPARLGNPEAGKVCPLAKVML